MKYLLFFCWFLSIAASSQCWAQNSNVQTNPITQDTSSNCKPSLPLEIGVTSIVWGLPSYWTWRVLFDADTSIADARVVFIAPSLFLLMISLAPVADWTSGCSTSYWHSLWIGFAAETASLVVYGSLYGFRHRLNIYKFNLPEYLALGLLPSVGASMIYNLFLHPKDKNNNQGMFIFPSIDSKNTASLNFMMQF